MKSLSSLAILAALASFGQTPTTPYAAWELDDGSGTAAADSSGNKLTASLYNGPAWLPATQCIAAGCLSFNGANQYGSVALNLSDTTAVTVSFWMKWNAYANDDKLALEFGSGAAGYNNRATGFMINPNSSYYGGTMFEVSLKGDVWYNQVLFSRPSAGVWHHYAFVFNKANPAATEIIPYVDGVAVAYTKPTSGENSNAFGADTLYLMSRNGTSIFGAGALDDVRIYKRPLLPSEIAALSLQPIAVFGTGVTTAGVLLAGASTDGHYRLVSSPDTSFPGPNAIVVNSVPPWLPDGPNSKWIAPRASLMTGNTPGVYTYRTTFDLTGFNSLTAVLTGRWAADDSAVMKLNGAVVSTVPTFASWTSFTVSTGFVAGVNTLDFVVTNAGSSANPTGLRVDLSGQAATAAPSTIAVSVSPAAVSLQPSQNQTFTATVIGTYLIPGIAGQTGP